jgi:hypothetical protein
MTLWWRSVEHSTLQGRHQESCDEVQFACVSDSDPCSDRKEQLDSEVKFLLELSSAWHTPGATTANPFALVEKM